MALAIKDNIADGRKITLINTLASLDRQSEQTRFTKFKSALPNFSVPPTETFLNFEKIYPKDYSNGQKSQRDNRFRDSRPRDMRPKSPHWSTRNKRAGSASGSNFRVLEVTQTAGQVLHQLTSAGPSNSTCLIDTGAQCSCIGQQTFVNLGGNLKSLSKSENSYIFGDGKSSPSFGRTKIEFLVHEFNIDIVSQDVPRLIDRNGHIRQQRPRQKYLSSRYLRKTADSGWCQD